MQQSASEVLKDIKQKKLAPIYLLHGDEPYLIDQLVDAFEKQVLPEDQQSFNQFVLFGKDHSLGAIIATARRYPMMAERQVVIVKEAAFIEAMAKAKENAKSKDDDLKVWEEYCANPTPSTLLVLTVKSLLSDKSKVFSALVKHGVIVTSKKVAEDKLGAWLVDYLGQRGIKIQPSTVELMVSYVGADLSRMAHEADKLVVNVPAGSEVGSTEVEKYIGISREYNYFEFQKAIIQRNTEKAQKIAFHFAENTKQNPAAPMLVLLFNFFSKVLQVHDVGNVSDAELSKLIGVNPYFVRDYTTAARNYPLAKVVRIIEAIKNADLKVKGVIGSAETDREIILDLSFQILHL